MIGKPVRSLILGFAIPAEALRLILKKPKVLLWCAFPFLITLTLQYYLLATLQGSVGVFATWLSSLIGLSPSGFIAILIVWLSKILLFVLSILSFSLIASLVASPFNDFLAETTEAYALPPLPTVPSYAWTFKIRILWMDVIKTLFSMLGLIVALVFSWIPLLNLISLIFMVLLVTFQYASYPQTRRGYSLLQGLGFLRRHFFASVGFGSAFAFLFAIPFLNAFVLPLAVVGGTLLVAKAQQDWVR